MGIRLYFYISDESVGQWRWLKRLISKSKRYSILLSITTILFQFGAPCALFTSMLRPGIIALAMMFHLGIWLTMYPNYFATNMVLSSWSFYGINCDIESTKLYSS